MSASAGPVSEAVRSAAPAAAAPAAPSTPPALPMSPESGFVHDRVGIVVRSEGDGLVPVELLVGLALRRNPRRAHLLVSTVLAKHVPTVPGLAVVAGELLGTAADLALAEGDAGARGAELRRLADEFARLLAEREAEGEARARLRGDLAALRRELAALRTGHPGVATLGYAETATGLGRLVADALGSWYLHSTRHDPAGAVAFGAFEEAHSHATSHRLLPTDPSRLRVGGTVVLVDDELSTGATVVDTVRDLHARVPQERFVVAALVDLRGDDDRAALDAVARELGTRVDVVALGQGRVELPADVLTVGADVAAGLGEAVPTLRRASAADAVALLDLRDVVAPVRSERFGVDAPAATADVDVRGVVAAVLDALPAELREGVRGDDPVVVLGTEEFLSVPLAVAYELDGHVPTRASSTTRSPIAVLDRPDYAVASGVTFRSHDVTLDGPGPRHAYNLSRAGARPRVVVLMPEPGTDPAELVGGGSVTEALREVAEHVLVVLLAAADDGPAPAPALARPAARLTERSAVQPSPASTAPAAAPTGASRSADELPERPERPDLPEPLVGPTFGSYDADDVSWLLTDLGDAQLEAPAHEREATLQGGTANYAESLPIEYQPTPEYQALYEEALARSADRVATAVGVVTDLALAARDQAPVLVSLARAGTPVGVLMRRWAARVRGVDAPHLTMSIVRGVGLDPVALRWLVAHHDPARVVFVDGWTGKGAITRELTEALARFEETDGVRFGDDLAVLADPGRCASTWGTRDDFLIPSACLNSTVSGLVSRTVYNRRLIGDHDFHGGKFYSELADADVSRAFVDTVSARFDAVVDEVDRRVAAAATEPDRAAGPTWAGWEAVERISAEQGVHDVNLVKPGVGETTRVLLRRIPWKVLVRADALDEVRHVLLLAEQRGVPVEVVDELPYSCVGLIHPVHTAGATGADGRAVRAEPAPTAPTDGGAR
ncbi:phosphoribosyltransferase domain-containing protein [Frigoribacterium sp. CFBP 13707]|uniref:phosphoribosyltransferase domain-containing protein n=1 Tax=Frigoribacterium sp. CFBP 13707 TaxID=2775313 RepID=UPI0035302BD6